MPVVSEIAPVQQSAMNSVVLVNQSINQSIKLLYQATRPMKKHTHKTKGIRSRAHTHTHKHTNYKLLIYYEKGY